MPRQGPFHLWNYIPIRQVTSRPHHFFRTDPSHVHIRHVAVTNVMLCHQLEDNCPMPTYEVCIHIHRPHKPPHTRTARGWVYSTPKKYEPLRKGPGPSVGWRISPHIRVREGKTHRTHQCWLPFASNHTALPPSHRVQTAAPGGARVILVGVLDGKAGPRVRGVPVAGTAAASVPRALPVPVTQPPAALHKGMATGAHLKTGKQAWKGSLGRLEAEPGFTPRPSPPHLPTD